MNQKILLLFVLLMGFSVPQAKAEWLLKSVLNVEEVEIVNNGTSAKTSELTVDPTLLYIFSNGVLLGGQYYKSTIDSDSSKDEYTAYGPSIGLLNSGFIALLTYHYSLEWADTSGATKTINTGDGFTVDLGYLMEVSQSFLFGATVKYRTWKYDKRKVSGVSSNIDIEETGYRPYVTFAVRF